MADSKAPAAAASASAAAPASTTGATDDTLAPVMNAINDLSVRLAKLQQPGVATTQTQQLVGQVLKEFNEIAALLAESIHDSSLDESERARYRQLLGQVRGILHAHRALSSANSAANAAGVSPRTSARSIELVEVPSNPQGSGNPPLVYPPPNDAGFAPKAHAGTAHQNGNGVMSNGHVVDIVKPDKRDSLAIAPAALAKGAALAEEDRYAEEEAPTDPETPKTAPVDDANLWSLITYGWLNSIITRGRHSTIEAKHLPPVPKADRTNVLGRRWREAWDAQSEGRAVDDPENKAKVIPTIWMLWKNLIYLSAVLEGIWVGTGFATPYIVKALIKYIVEGGATSLGIGLAIALAATSEVNSLLMNVKFYVLTRVGCVSRAALMNAIYEKSLRLSSSAKQSATLGETVNLMSNDTQRVYEAFPFSNSLWTSPITIVICVILLWQQIGISTLASVVLMFCLIPFQIMIGKKIGDVRRRLAKHTDERVKFMSEILQGIRVVKLYAWEDSLAKVVYNIREKELQDIKIQGVLKAVNGSLLFFWPVLVTAATFLCYSLLDGDVNTGSVFVVLAFLNVLRFPVILIPYAIATMVEGYVGATRIDRFLKLEEIDTRHRKVVTDAPGPFLRVTDGEFKWAKDQTAPTLTNINLDVKTGELVAIIGHVGVGKSSLFHAMLGEMHCTKGGVEVQGRIAYMSQENWIRNTTVRNNILFGLPYDADRYQMVLDAAALRPDIAILADGDSTEIGERGVTLSGGQKARVSLARAVYRAALSDIYLLDDPLSAVDMNVGRQMMYNCILGLLKGKTRVVILNSHLHFLPLFDRIVVVNNTTGNASVHNPNDSALADAMASAGLNAPDAAVPNAQPPADGAANGNGAHANGANGASGDAKSANEAKSANGAAAPASPKKAKVIKPGFIEVIGPFAEVVKTHRDLMRADDAHNAEADEKAEGDKFAEKTKAKEAERDAATKAAGGKDAAKAAQAAEDEKKAKDAKKLIEAEDRVVGGVGGNVIVRYYDSAAKGWGWAVMIGLLFVMCVGQVARVFSDYWLTWWAADYDYGDANAEHAKEWWYVGYAILVVVTAGLLILRGTALALSAVDSSRQMHAELFSNLLRAPTPTFFDVTPVGRVINRFSKDLDNVDLFLPDFVGQFIVNALQIVSVVILAIIGTPWFLLILFPVVILFWYVQMYFRISSREIKRLEGVTRSPVYSSFGETLTGVTTIRAYGMAREFERNNRKLVDLNAKAFFLSYTSERWLAIRLDYLAATLVLTVALLFTGLRDTVDPSLAGLAIIYSLQLMGFLQYTVRLSVMAENTFTSVERLLHYTQIPAERPYRIPEKAPSADWPQTGQITISNMTMRYRDDLPDVLKDVSVTLRPREKVGVCGRTGSGKSSLLVALFRLVEAQRGSIQIDGIDIGQIGLGDLRSKLSIIPQDPVLFSGPLRFNLDPFNVHTDDKIMAVLDRVHLGDFVRSLPTKLQHKVVEYGENFSHGQRQLICIARALLRESKILCLDEATASIDSETDARIQETLRVNFADCTVLTIAHRLETIRDCDRILVLDHGRVAEFDSPDNLLAKPGGVFAGMVDQAGEQAAAKFRRGTAGGKAAAAAALLVAAGPSANGV